MDVLESVSEIELWDSFKKGDEVSFKSIYSIHYSMLHQYAFNICKDDQITIDALQDLFSDLWHSRRRLGPVTSIKAYLFSSIRRRVLVKLKKNRRKQVLALEIFTHHPDIEFSQEMIRIREEKDFFRKSIIKEALSVLSKRQREVIYLRFYQEIPLNEVAEIMNIKYQSVVNLCQSALKNLRNNSKLLRVVSGEFSN